jgi:hypothetical protein
MDLILRCGASLVQSRDFQTVELRHVNIMPFQSKSAKRKENSAKNGVVHDLKCWPEFFTAIVAGEKRHDLRRTRDRQFKVGDRLRLQEYDHRADAYTGREQMVVVTYITSAAQPCALSDEALHPDYCILSIAFIDDQS